MRKIILSLLVLFSGCATLPDGQKGTWFALNMTDEFDDKSVCYVTVGRTYKLKGKHYQKGGGYYPFIAKTENGLRVGVKSGDRIPVPVGDVQLRVDKQDAWEISTSETPLKDIPSNPAMDAMKDNPQAQQLYQTSMEAVTRSMSPFTVTTGDKARAILDQMLEGKQLIYRTKGLNTTSSTGKFPLDDSLPRALARCGIT